MTYLPIKNKNYQVGFFYPANIRRNGQIHNHSMRFVYNSIRNIDQIPKKRL